jgi:hypothetical protein
MNNKETKVNKNVKYNKEKQPEKVEEIKIVEETKKEKTKRIIKKVWDVVFWIGITLLAAIWLTDFIKVQNEEKPKFCLVEKTHKFDDGTVNECIGLGYKVYIYNRDSINDARQFSPFFIGMKK